MAYGRRALLGVWIGAFAVLGAPAPSTAGSVPLPYSFGSGVRTQSIVEARFSSAVPQEYDFSCGAAAVATLLTYHYERATSESEVFRYMWEQGDREKIRAVGFSLLNMKRFLNAQGYAAGGYRITLEQLQQVRTPAIALITTQGYRHFVVIQGVSDEQVLIGDPALGVREVPRAHFDAIRDDILLVIPPPEGQPGPGLRESWRLRPPAPLGHHRDAGKTFARTQLLLPQLGDL